MNLNPSPKSKFVADPNLVKAHRALMENPQLDISLDQAMLVLQRHLQNQMSPDEARAAHYEMSGALLFLDIFRNLAEVPVPRKTPTNTQLE